jgi:outer membrane murein-binding lipoprotein Lpp
VEAGRREAATFAAEKTSLGAAIERATHEKASAANQVIDLSAQISKLEIELKSARDELKIAKQQMANMKHEIELNQNSMSKINREHLETTEEAYGFR